MLRLLSYFKLMQCDQSTKYKAHCKVKDNHFFSGCFKIICKGILEIFGLIQIFAFLLFCVSCPKNDF